MLHVILQLASRGARPVFTSLFRHVTLSKFIFTVTWYVLNEILKPNLEYQKLFFFIFNNLKSLDLCYCIV